MKLTFLILPLFFLLAFPGKSSALTDTIPDSYEYSLLEIDYEIRGLVREFGGLDKIPLDSIWKMEYIAAELATPVYGEPAKDGLIAIVTKSMAQRKFRKEPDNIDDIPTDLQIHARTTRAEPDTGYEKIFYKVEVSAQFPGGEKGWVKYVEKEIDKHIAELADCKECYGTCTIKFIVDIDGTVRDAIPENMTGTKLAEFAVDIIMNGPKWSPAYQNGKPVKAYKRQSITINAAN